jgi:hypothetical protein
MSRLGWIVFNQETNMDQAMELIDNKPVYLFNQVGVDFVLQVGRQNDKTTFKRIGGYVNKPKRLEQDLGKAKRLAQFLDTECGIDGVSRVQEYLDTKVLPNVAPQENKEGEENPDGGSLETKLGDTVEQGQDAVAPGDPEDINVNVPLVKKELDFWILYLHYVHFFDFYTGVESLSPEDHARRGALPMRYAYSADSKLSYQISRVDQMIDMRMGNASEKIAQYTKDATLETEKTISLYVRKETEGKYRCVECQKLFRGEDFVRKHIRSKHPELFEHVPFETAFFNCWALDGNKIEVRGRRDSGRGGERGYDRGGSGYDRRSFGSGSHGGGAGGRRDARQVRSYHDLDRPADGHIQLNYD